MNPMNGNRQLSPEELAVIELEFELDLEFSPAAHDAAVGMTSDQRAEVEASALRKLRHLSLDSLPLLRKEAI